ncbi:MAG: 3-phosphoshikimate 1-carboxyvinyltransferase [Bacteroidetes bacterium]|nr:3-phosphoshikimate 1-carboxyvinyltransferase [Bacteroidota bacterium]
MNAVIFPSTLKGSIRSNASKSAMQRACAAALISGGKTIIQNPGISNDDRAAMDIIQKLGVVLAFDEQGNLIVESKGVNPKNYTIDCGESGLSIRMFTPLAALSSEEIIITGSGSLSSRPMDFFDHILPQLGVSVSSKNGKLPLKVKGPVKPSNIEIDGSLSSQFLTGLLMCYAVSGASDVSIIVNNLKSKPYIDLTLDVMRKFGMKVPENRDYREFYFSSENKSNVSNDAVRSFTVEGDWSGAAFLLVAGAVSGSVRVHGLDLQSTQADRAIMLALQESGARISYYPDYIEISQSKLKAFSFDATECPDLFPPLVALAAFCEGETMLVGTNRLTHKESNRALTLQETFGRLGVPIELKDNVMLVQGGQPVKGGIVHSHHDHRIAMAAAVAALRAEASVEIEHAEAINKSYPEFYNDLVKLGGKVDLMKTVS